MGDDTKRNAWHAMDAAAVMHEQGSQLEGLSAEEVAHRLERFGPNKIREEKPVTAWPCL